MTDHATLLLAKQLKGAAWATCMQPLPGFGAPQTDSLAPVPHTDLQKNPNSGFSAGLADDTNMFEWQVTIIGPPDTY